MSEIATIRRLPAQGMVTIRGTLGDATFKAAVKSVTGHAVPAQRQISGALADGLAWMSPDELMLFCAHGDAGAKAAALSDGLAGQHHMAVNVSDARAVFAIEGAVREVLTKLAPVDMAPGQFAPAEIRRTRLSQVAAAFWMESEGLAHLVCFRSVGQYVGDVLEHAAQTTLELQGWSD